MLGWPFRNCSEDESFPCLRVLLLLEKKLDSDPHDCLSALHSRQKATNPATCPPPVKAHFLWGCSRKCTLKRSTLFLSGACRRGDTFQLSVSHPERMKRCFLLLSRHYCRVMQQVGERRRKGLLCGVTGGTEWMSTWETCVFLRVGVLAWVWGRVGEERVFVILSRLDRDVRNYGEILICVLRQKEGRGRATSGWDLCVCVSVCRSHGPVDESHFTAPITGLCSANVVWLVLLLPLFYSLLPLFFPSVRKTHVTLLFSVMGIWFGTHICEKQVM